MNKPKIAIIAPYVGIINRGAETFVIEVALQLQKDFDVTVFSEGVSPLIKEQTVQVSIARPKLLTIYSQAFAYLSTQNDLFKTTANPLLKIWRLANKVIYRTITLSSFLFPATMEQKIFTEEVFNKYITNGEFSVIFPNNGIWGARLAAKYRDKTGVPFMYTGHGGIGAEEKLILETKPNTYIATTKEAETWAKSVSSASIQFIPIGVNIKRFSQQFSIKEEHKTLQQPIVLCVAALTSFKRHSLLINAMQKLNKGHLIIIGRGELEQSLRDLCEKLIPGRYTLLPVVPYVDIPYYFSLCNVFSLPSENEPFGIVYVEALAANKPIVAPNDDSRKDIIGNAGILCDVTNATEYAKAIEQAASQQWDSLPCTRAMNFSWDTIGSKYRDLFFVTIQK